MKQLSIVDIIPDNAKANSENFAYNMYEADRNAEFMPEVNTRHEGYGILASANAQLMDAVGNLKSDMKDMLSALAIGDKAFQTAVDSARETIIELLTTAVGMYEHTMNVGAVMAEINLENNPAPLLDMVNDELPGDDTEGV